MLFDKPKLSEPNEMGFQFGINKDLTKWAHDEQNNWGNIMPSVNITVLEVWKDDVRQAYLLVDEKTNEPIQDCNDYEAAAVAIDKYKLLYKSSELDK